MPAGRELRPVSSRRPLEATLPRLRSFVSPFTGVVRSLGETLAAPDEHRLVSIGCELADGRPTIGDAARLVHGQRALAARAGRGGGDRRGARALRGLVRPARADRRRIRAASSVPTPSSPAGSRSSREAQYATRRFRSGRSAATPSSAGSTGFSLPDGRACLLARAARLHAVAAAGARTRCASATRRAAGWRARRRSRRRSSPGCSSSSSATRSCSSGTTGCRCRCSTGATTTSSSRLDRRYFAPAGLRVLGRRPERLPRHVPTVLGVVHGAARAGSVRSASARRARRRSPSPGGRRSPRRSPSSAGCATRRSRSRSGSARRSTTIQTFDDHTLYYADEERAAAGGVPRRLAGAPTRDRRGRAARGRRTSSS